MVMSTTCLLFGLLELGVGLRQHRDLSMIMWGSGNLAGSVGGVVVSLREMTPDIVSIAVGNALLATFWALIWAGGRVFAGQPVRWVVVIVGPALLLGAFIFVPPFSTSVVMRVYLASGVLVGYFGLCGIDGLRAQGSERLVARRVLVALCFVAFIPTIVRAVGVGVHGPQSLMTSSTLATSITMMALYLMVISINVCLLLMSRERLENQLAYAAMLDPLTTVLNRTGFLIRGQQLANECAARQRRCSVLMMDLDQFKTINDVFGHSAGDRLLVEFAALIQSRLRTGDLVARVGGEEFCVALPGAGEQQAAEIAERLRLAFAAATFAHEDITLTGTVSIGVTELGYNDSLLVAMRRADVAMYAAKNRGRDRVVCASAPSE